MSKKRSVRYEVRWNCPELMDAYGLDSDYLILLTTRTEFGARWWIKTRVEKEKRDQYEVVQVTRVDLTHA